MVGAYNSMQHSTKQGSNILDADRQINGKEYKGKKTSPQAYVREAIKDNKSKLNCVDGTQLKHR